MTPMLASGLRIRPNRSVAVLLLSAAIAACIAAQASAASSRPVSSSTGRTNEDPCASTSALAAGAQRVLPGGRTVGGGLDLTKQESQVLAGVEDHTGRLADDPALYMLLARAASLPALSSVQMSCDLDRPAYANLLADPEYYRARPMGMRVRVRSIRRLQPVEGACRDWRDPNEGPLWCLECYRVSPRRGASEALIVFCTTQPALGKPDKVNPDGEEVYDRSVPEAELAGLFHKLYSVQDPNGQRFDYPVVLAWQLDRASDRTVSPYPTRTFFAVGMVLLGYGILRWQLKRRESRRQDEDLSRRRAATGEPAGDAPVGQVDPLLVEAAEEHQRHHQDGTRHKG